MIDKLKIDDISDFDLETPTDPKFSYREGFKTRVQFTGNVEHWINELLIVNDYKNVIYIHENLTRSLSGSELEEIKKFTTGRRVIFTGIKTPGGLSYATIREGSNHSAEKMFITPTSTEKIEVSSPAWSTFSGFLSKHLNQDEIKKYHGLLFDELHKTREFPEAKYDYERSEEKRMGVALKQLFVIHHIYALLERGYKPELFLSESTFSQYRGDYNQPIMLFYLPDRLPSAFYSFLNLS